MEDNLKTEAAANEAGELVDDSTVALGKRVRGMIKKIDKQLAGRKLLLHPPTPDASLTRASLQLMTKSVPSST